MMVFSLGGRAMGQILRILNDKLCSIGAGALNRLNKTRYLGGDKELWEKKVPVGYSAYRSHRVPIFG